MLLELVDYINVKAGVTKVEYGDIVSMIRANLVRPLPPSNRKHASIPHHNMISRETSGDLSCQTTCVPQVTLTRTLTRRKKSRSLRPRESHYFEIRSLWFLEVFC